MGRSILVFMILLTTVSASPGHAQSADDIDELKACAKMPVRDARYACFDSLAERVLRDESADEESTLGNKARPEAAVPPAAISAPPPSERSSQEKVVPPAAVAVPAATGAQPPPDDVATLTVGDDKESKSAHYSGRITSCKKGHYGDWFFNFDNGQVWKEVSRRKLEFEECNFDATITKDLFGYKLSIAALEKPIRVKRQK